jgi:hypothetical protein
MPFFIAEPGSSGGGFIVNRLWWLYIAVTIPLTCFVVLAWIFWLKYLEMPLFKREAFNPKEPPR